MTERSAFDYRPDDDSVVTRVEGEGSLPDDWEALAEFGLKPHSHLGGGPCTCSKNRSYRST